jgi:protease IV
MGDRTMFSRRHPFLFFILVFSAISATALILLMLVISVGFRSSQMSTFHPGGKNKVGVIELNGVIAESKNVIHHIKQFREDDSIKAIILRIDSPGGTVGPAQEIYREVRKTIGVKKVVASMGTVAASGGYYIAAGADGIMANPGTITGSIGVIIGYTNFRQLLDKIGLTPVVIKSGAYKDLGSPVREMTSMERDIMQQFVDKTRRQFVEAVSEGRSMPFEQVDALADGRIYTGQDAKVHGLVDRLGNLEDAIEWVGEMAGMKGKITAVYAKDRPFSMLEQLMGEMIQTLEQRLSNSAPQASYIYQYPPID